MQCSLRTRPTNTKVFCMVITMCEKQILARAVEIQKDNWGNHAFFRDN